MNATDLLWADCLWVPCPTCKQPVDVKCVNSITRTPSRVPCVARTRLAAEKAS